MLSSDQLRGLLANPQSDRVPFTESTNNTDKFGQAVCAFASDFANSRQPGYLLAGVNGQGVPVGLRSAAAPARRPAVDVNLEPLPV